MTAERTQRDSIQEPAAEPASESDTEREPDTGPTGAAEPPAEAAAEAAAAPGAAEAEQVSRDRYLRLAAEYDNFRRRTERERLESWARAQAQLVEQLLDPLDDLVRVAEHAGEESSREALLEGVQLVERKLMRALESAGLEVVDPAGEAFNPELHEAVMRLPAETEEEDDTVAQVFQRGYQFKGVLLRPARVQVRKYD